MAEDGAIESTINPDDAPPATSEVSAGGFRLNVLEEGPRGGSPVVLVHGGGTWLYSFRRLVGPLAERGYRVLALDMPGHGYTRPEAGVRPAYTLGMTTAVLGAFLDAVGVESPAHLVGNSWGGGWALRFAQGHPGRVASLGLLASSGFRGREAWLYEALKYPLIGELSALIASRGVARRFYRRAFREPGLVTEAMVDAAFAPMAASRGNRLAQCRLMRRLDWGETESAMAGTRTPALVIWGREDRLWPASMAARFGAAMPDCRVEVFEGCGHLPHEEMPGRTIDRLVRFWRSLGDPGPAA